MSAKPSSTCCIVFGMPAMS